MGRRAEPLHSVFITVLMFLSSYDFSRSHGAYPVRLASRGWRGGSVVKGTGRSFRGLGFNSQRPLLASKAIHEVHRCTCS